MNVKDFFDIYRMSFSYKELLDFVFEVEVWKMKR